MRKVKKRKQMQINVYDEEENKGKILTIHKKFI